MKKNRLILLFAIAAGFFQLACGDEKVYFDNFPPGEGPKIKFIHAASDTVGVNLFLNDLKITGNSPSTIITSGAPNLGKVNIGTVSFVNSYPVTNYATVEASSGEFSVIFPESYNATTTFNSKTLSRTNAPTLGSSSYYTVAFVGVSPSYETVVYEDDLANAPVDGQIYVRFANFINNATDNLTLRLTPPPTTEDPNPAVVTLFQNVGYKQMTGLVPLQRTGTYTNIQVLNATTNAVIATLSSANSALVTNKVYTIFAHGRIGTTGPSAPGVSRMINR